MFVFFRHRSRFLLAVLGVALGSGCSSKGAANDEDGDTEAATGGTTESPAPPVETDTDPLPPPPDESSEEGGFIERPDGGIPGECDLWAQDCPAGQKCMPWVNDGGASWNDTHCTDLAGNPGQPGDACSVEGNAGTGIDDCDIGAMCWAVDPETNEGVCIALCEGSPDSALCSDPDAFCSITNDGVLPLCLPTCDPLLQDCVDGQGCYWLPGEEGFVCVQDVSGELGAPGDPCDGFTLNRCSPGTQCLPAEAVPECTGASSCCSSFCDTEEVSPGCLAAQECTALFEEGEAPPGTDTYGVCAIPTS